MYERPGRGVDLTANAVLTHNVPHYQGGIAGVPIKQDNPKTLDSLASRTQIQSGVKYFLRTKGVCEVDATSLAGATVGAAGLHQQDHGRAPDGHGGRGVPLGRVIALAGQFGTPTGKLRVNMDLKDNVASRNQGGPGKDGIREMARAPPVSRYGRWGKQLQLFEAVHQLGQGSACQEAVQEAETRAPTSRSS
jgi:hypothetical protein